MWDDDAGYDRDDPKHPDWADAMADKADRERDTMREDGTWWKSQASGLSLGEFRRRELEDEHDDAAWKQERPDA